MAPAQVPDKKRIYMSSRLPLVTPDDSLPNLTDVHDVTAPHVTPCTVPDSTTCVVMISMVDVWSTAAPKSQPARANKA
jgi:hypothetical protein